MSKGSRIIGVRLMSTKPPASGVNAIMDELAALRILHAKKAFFFLCC
ncbi:MAG: hypothetical protein M3156_05115 [Thermoproteota archaeon]|nr:hypothetical protein [Thermoproteota archaeon]